jgi:hypothetical protein
MKQPIYRFVIIVKLKGGLGNQMFQYAAGKALALRHRVPLKLDLGYLESLPDGKYTKRTVELFHLNISAEPADAADLENFKKHKSTPLRNVIDRLFPAWQTHCYLAESGHGYQRVFDRAPASTYLDGFWQSERYFRRYSDMIRSEFKPSAPLNDRQNTVLSQIGEGNSVSIHVRRGDFISLPEAHAFHGVCGLSYYQSAIEHVMSKVPKARFFIFSDDPDWCRANFTHQNAVVLEPGEIPAHDLWLMSRCSHHIIANSSFSWWGAWLNEKPGKIVVAPRFWYTNVGTRSLPLACDNWTIL